MTSKKRNVIIWSIVGLLIVAGGFAVNSVRKPTLQDKYRELKVGRGQIDVTIMVTGVAQPENRLEIKPPIAGRVETVISKEGDNVKKGQVMAWMSSTERAALLDAARARGDAEVKKWTEYYQATPIIAPINGTIILRSVEPGQTFSGTDAVFVMSDRLTIKANVDETDIANIKLKMTAEVVLDAYSDNKIDGTVDQIAFDAKTVNSVTTYIVDVLPNTIPQYMRSGMTANVKFHIATKENVLLVPSEAIRRKDNRVFVMVPNGDNAVEKDIQIGVTDGKKTEVLNGLNEGDAILSLIPKKMGASGTNPFAPTGPRRGR